VKILHVFKNAFPPTYGGVEQHIWDVARSLDAEFESSVLASSGSRRRVEEEVDGIRIVRSPAYGRVLSTPITPSWWREIRHTDAAVVHLHLPLPFAELVTVASRPPVPVVASVHADAVSHPVVARGYAILQQQFLSRVESIVVGSHVLAETSPALARHRNRTCVIPYGVDREDWPADPDQVARIRGGSDGPIVLFLGRLVAYKGLDVLLEAMRTVDATLLVVGSGPERLRLETAAPERVRFVGNVTNEERSAYYRAAEVFVLPSVTRAESFGIAMLEAMSLGTPAVSTEVGTATSWVNRAGETGLVVPPGDPAALADAIKALLADSAMRSEFGEAAAFRAREHFSKKVMLDRLADVYRGVFASTSR
jgi:rhamnosyl/mannosyltransferase